MNQVNTEPQPPAEEKNDTISGGQQQSFRLPNIGFDHLVFVLGMVILFLAALRFNAGLIALVCVSAAALGAVICVHFFYRNISNKLIGHPAIKNDLHAYVVNLHVNFQTATTFVVFGAALLSFFGIQTYQNFKDVQFEELKAEIKKQEDYVNTLTEKTNSAIKRADSLRQAIKTVTAITDSLLSVKLNNVVVAYAGRDSMPEGWRLYENSVNKFIQGVSQIRQQGDTTMTWGSYDHEHKTLATSLSGKILLSELTESATIREILAAKKHEFRIDTLRNANADVKTAPSSKLSVSAHRLRYIVYKGTSSNRNATP